MRLKVFVFSNCGNYFQRKELELISTSLNKYSAPLDKFYILDKKEKRNLYRPTDSRKKVTEHLFVPIAHCEKLEAMLRLSIKVSLPIKAPKQELPTFTRAKEKVAQLALF